MFKAVALVLLFLNFYARLFRVNIPALLYLATDNAVVSFVTSASLAATVDNGLADEIINLLKDDKGRCFCFGLKI